jgi:hypothetical protein
MGWRLQLAGRSTEMPQDSNSPRVYGAAAAASVMGSGQNFGTELQRAAHLSEIRRVAEGRLRGGVFDAAVATKAHLDQLGAEIAVNMGCVLLAAPVKSMERAGFKVTQDYEGHWLSLKDVARITLVVSNPAQLPAVVKAVRRRFAPVNGNTLTKDEETLPHIDECGYSGHNFVVRFGMTPPNAPRAASSAGPVNRAAMQPINLPPEQIVVAVSRPAEVPKYVGRMGEIQVNTIAMIYGKMSQSSFVAKAGLGRTKYLECLAQFGVEGGAGHSLYEIYRKAKKSPEGLAAAELSRRYYKRLRGQDARPWEGALKKEVAPHCKGH